MKTNKSYFELKNSSHNIISGDIYHPENPITKLPLIIISHGFKGFKDWGFAPYLSSTLAENGFIAICFNFSMNGNPDSNAVLTNPDDFANNTVSKQLDDLNFLIESVINNSINGFEEIKNDWDGSIYLLGHSLGAALSLIIANENSFVNKVALWASPATFERNSERQVEEWKENGFLEFLNQRTNQLIRMNLSYLEDIETNKERFDIPKTVSSLKKPILLLHGTQDFTVPLKEAKKLINADKNKNITYKFISKTGHTFGIEHPFTNTNPALEEAIRETIDFFRL